MAQQDLSKMSLAELTELAMDKKIDVPAGAKKPELITLIESVSAPQEAPAPTAPAPQEAPLLNAKQVKELFDRINDMQSRIDELSKGKEQPSADNNSDRLVQALLNQVKGIKNEAGTLLADAVPGPEDMLPQPAKFWCRSLNWGMRELFIGSVPQALPYGMDKIKFEPICPPFQVRDPNQPIPQVVTICQFKTSRKGLAEALRKDARYGRMFFEDVHRVLSTSPKLNEFNMEFARQLTLLRSRMDDQNYIFAQAQAYGVPYSQGTSMEALINLIAQTIAEQLTSVTFGQLAESEQQRARERAMAAGSMPAIGIGAPPIPR